MTSGSTLGVVVSGAGSDSLVVTTNSGDYQIEFDGAAACSGYSDSSYSTVQVTDTGGVPTVFQPGTDTNITFEGPGGASTLDLTAAPAATSVTLNGDSPASLGSVPWSGGTDQFSGVSTFLGSSAGGSTFVAGPAGGYSFQGNGSGNTLDLSAAPSGVTVTQNGDSLSSPGVVANLNIGLGGSTSDTFSGIQVVRLSSAMSLSSSADPSVFGQAVTFTATITPTDGGGTVAFYADGSASPIPGCETQSLTQVSGSTYSATCTTSSLSAGAHTISAAYSGDSSSTSSTASLASGQTVNRAAQSISFTAPGTGTVGTSATLTATGGASGNPVVFSVDSSSGAGVCSVSGTNGSTVNYAAAGSCVIDANQAGNADYTAAPQVTQIISVNKVATITTLASSANPSIIGAQVTYTATVSPASGTGMPTGQVAFSDGTTPISGCGAVTVGSTGTATCKSTYNAVGSHTITAEYLGDATYQASTSAALTQQVAYQVQLLYDQAKATNSGSTVSIKLQLLNAVGANLSTAGITVTVTGLSPSPAPGKAPTGTFTFLTLDQGPGYQLNVKTSGYPAGTYTLSFTAGSDPTAHTAEFVIS